jgi:ketosteroid isomerase-like protein
MSANVDLVRSIYADWERGDYSSVEWAHPDIEYMMADGPEPGASTGVVGIQEGLSTILDVWEDWRPEVQDYRELDCERVLVLTRRRARGKTSGLEIEQTRTRGATLWRVCDDRVTKLVIYWDRERAFADLGLAPETDSQR